MLIINLSQTAATSTEQTSAVSRLRRDSEIGHLQSLQASVMAAKRGL